MLMAPRCGPAGRELPHFQLWGTCPAAHQLAAAIWGLSCVCRFGFWCWPHCLGAALQVPSTH